MQGEHDCENCIFNSSCTPFEKQIDNFCKNCSNYVDIDFEDYQAVNGKAMSWNKYTDTLWKYIASEV